MMKSKTLSLILILVVLALAVSPVQADAPVRLQDDPQPDPQDTPFPTIPMTAGNSGLNPLTGLPVQHPENLLLPPALVSVTNFPPTARPQAGLSFSPIVFELYIGDGMTRYLALFYGDFPQAALPDSSGDVQSDLTAGLPQPAAASVGPVRSGRLPYEHIRKLFNGFIVMASAYEKVANQLSDFVNVFGDDNTDPNSALIPVDKLEDIAKANEDELGTTALTGMYFNNQVPPDGKDAQSLWIFYAYKNQVFWRYNQTDGSYHRWQDDADGQTFIEQTDRLNGNPLTYENVIVLFADHDVQNKYLIDVDLLYVKRGKALLFRDGQMYEIYWTTKSEEYEKTTGKLRPIRFIDAEGNPFPLKPGQTWIELVPNYTTYWETVDSEKYNQLVAGRSKGSGYWGLYFNLDD
ncbi:MAG: hypothetical protein PWQ55_2565 [Chloroflexota bacterium]|nr:hypothetical protein [Chloroflexota bacterium]